MQFDPQSRRPDIAGGGHLDMIAGAKHQRAEHTTDRLCEACAGILGGGGRIGKAAAPGRAPPQRMRSEAMNEIDGERSGYRNEDQHQQSVVRTATLRDRHDRKPGLVGLYRHAAAENLGRDRRKPCAVSAASLRGRPRNVTPNALTKHAAARAAARASNAPTAGTMILSAHCGSWGLCSTAWKISHSETKPLNGGSAEMATQPTRNTKLVSGIRWMRPPSLSMSRSPVEFRTAPAPKKSQLLKNEWLST